MEGRGKPLTNLLIEALPVGATRHLPFDQLNTRTDDGLVFKELDNGFWIILSCPACSKKKAQAKMLEGQG
jgi:hypothetical protein